MDKELKEKWVAALRSGEYQQGRYYLRSEDDRYCCLGVLGCLIGKDKKEMTGDKSGMTPKGWKLIPENEIEHLIQMNDGHDDRQQSFQAIAAYIEEHL
jgi:hypothetical protein